MSVRQNKLGQCSLFCYSEGYWNEKIDTSLRQFIRFSFSSQTIISPTTNINDNANSKNLEKKLNYLHHKRLNGRTGLPYLVKKKVHRVISRAIVMDIFCFGQNCTNHWTQYLRLLKHDIALKAPRRKILKFRFVTWGIFWSLRCYIVLNMNDFCLRAIYCNTVRKKGCAIQNIGFDTFPWSWNLPCFFNVLVLFDNLL